MVRYPVSVLSKNNDPQFTERNKSVLVFPHNNLGSNAHRDLFFQGNLRNECNLNFDCEFHSIFSEKDAHLESFDALIVGLNQGVKNLIKAINASQKAGKKRPLHQVWIYWGSESSKNPSSSWYLDNPLVKSGFNWTVFLSSKATIHRPYFRVWNLSRDNIDYPQINSFLNRSKNICWIVSHCPTASKRESLASELIRESSSKVHVWGNAYKKCLKSVAGDAVDHGQLPMHYKDVYFQQTSVIRDCKFYFSFENSICSDYITEKFGNGLMGGAIPVVNGWRESYDKVLPGSFVHVDDFNSTKEVIEHLEYVLDNEAAFQKYQEWRQRVKVEANKYEAACDVCQKLASLDRKLEKGTHVPDIIPDMKKEIFRLEDCKK